jgi:putative sigma-54 modulation protein
MTDVSVSVTFRHTRSSAALKLHAEEKVSKMGKYFDAPLEAHVVLSVDSKDRHVAEVTVQTRRLTLHGKEETTDLYSAIDLVVDKIEQQIRKHKSRLQKRREKD